VAFSAALSTTGPADFKVAWLLGLFEKTLPGPGKIYPGLTFSSLPWALASPAADPYHWGMYWSADNGSILRPGCPRAPRHDKFLRALFFTCPMKFRLLGAGVVLAASVLAPQQAHALVTTTQYVPFKIFQNPALNGPAFPLNFQNFNTAFGGDTSTLNLTGIGFKIAGASDGTGTATVAGNPRVTNQNEDDVNTAFISYAPQFSFVNSAGNMTGPITGTITDATDPVPCALNQSCPNPGGGTTIPTNATRTLNLAGNTYGGTGGFASIAMQNAWRTGSVNTATAGDTPTANFSGSGTDMAYNFDPKLSASVISKPYIEGWIAVQYQYDVIPSAVPGPLPLFGAAAAFGWSRRLKKRISSAA
jgi:hypothetical protein